ncbi:putative WRKY transcription factor 49 [Tasmannia lanceolata]|uniref:putative WRKY transcription factor 49 n=1 Tax=Tasmannia lanceolata TaxID=3420 RepID=UPI00406429B6
MAATEELNSNWSEGSQDELVRELLDDETPFFVLPKIAESEPVISSDPMMNNFLSKVYSGPTIEDIRRLLSATYHSKSDEHITSQPPTISMSEKALKKMENKYTLKIKSCGNGMAEDGYKWRKYGQKSIKNSLNPRSYYRCTNPRCNAKKQVERSSEDPDTLVVTYEGLHLHFAYSHFLLTRPSDYLATLQTPKRPKTLTLAQQAQSQTNDQTQAQKPESPQVGPTLPTPITCLRQEKPVERHMETPQGLLEDVVPLMIRNPLNNTEVSSNPCFSTYPSSPPSSSSSSSFPSSSNSYYFDVGILSSIR